MLSLQVTVEATLEHPFFVFGQGWSSCQPERTLQRYGLSCQKLSVGDVCISLTHKDLNMRHSELLRQSHDHRSSHDPYLISDSSTGTTTRVSTVKPMSPAATPPSGNRASDITDRESSRSHYSQRQAKTPPSRMASAAQPLAAEAGASTAATVAPSASRKRRWSAPDQFTTVIGATSSGGGSDNAQQDVKPLNTSGIKTERGGDYT